MTLVIDASVAIEASIAQDGFNALAGQALLAPALMWSEAFSVLHERRSRSDLTAEQALAARAALSAAPIARIEDPRIEERGWRLADELGWAKTLRRRIPCDGGDRSLPPAHRRSAPAARCRAARARHNAGRAVRHVRRASP